MKRRHHFFERRRRILEFEIDTQQRPMALLGVCHRTIRTVQRPENTLFRIRKPLPTDPSSFGERFRAARVAQGQTQTQMARKFGVSLSTVKFWEQNRTRPNATIRYHLEEFLKSCSPAIPELAHRGATVRVGNLQSKLRNASD